jgi:hypothetical protein
LKARLWWLIIGVIVILALAISIDRTELRFGKVLQAKGTSKSATLESIVLQACDSTQGDFSGPLVPDLNIADSESSLVNAKPDEKVPISAWSRRAGFGISTPIDPEYWAQMLGSGWYIDWTVRAAPSLDNLDHWSIVRVHEDCISPSMEEIQRATARFPGQVWIIGNEPDVIWQDNVKAAKYAAIYHVLYELIKTSDPTALIAVGGVSQATPLRLQFLDQVLQAYQNLYHEPMPVDWWTVHGYVLREEKGSWGVDIPPGIEATQGELREVVDHGRLDLFEAQIRAFREWMAEHGYQHTPLALTEFGILMPSSYGFPSDMVARYLEQTFTWLSQVQDESSGYPEDGYLLVQKWAWFSISDSTYSSSNLGDLSSGKLTLVGERFRNTVSSMVP